MHPVRIDPKMYGYAVNCVECAATRGWSAKKAQTEPSV